MHSRSIERVIDLTDPGRNVLYDMSPEQARALVASGNPAALRRLNGQFALVASAGEKVRMARSISRPLRPSLQRASATLRAPPA